MQCIDHSGFDPNLPKMLCLHMFFSEKFYIETSFLSSLGGAATQRASSGAQEGAKRAASNSVMGVSLQVC